MKQIFTESDKNAFLFSHIQNTGGYFIVKYDNETHLIWFTHFNLDNKPEEDWYLESPCYLVRVEIQTPEMEEYYRSVEYSLFPGYALGIDSPQTSPFLPEQFEIEFFSKEEKSAIEWLLMHSYADHDWDLNPFKN